MTKLDNIMVNPDEEKCAHEHFYRKMTDYTKYLCTLVEMGVVRSIATVNEKLEDQGMDCMLLVYAQINTGGTHRTLNLRTKLIILRCEIIWLEKLRLLGFKKSKYQVKHLYPTR